MVQRSQTEVAVFNLERALRKPFRLLRPAGDARLKLISRGTRTCDLAADARIRACSSDCGSLGHCLDKGWSVVCSESDGRTAHGTHGPESASPSHFCRWEPVVAGRALCIADCL